MLGFGAVRHHLEVVNAVCYHPIQVNTIQNSTFHVCFVFPRQPKHTHVYGVPIRFHAMSIMSSMDLCCHIYLSAKRVCLNLTNQVSKTLTFPTPPTNGNEGPGNAPREKIPNELPVPMPSLEPPERDGDDVMDQDLHVNDPKWKGYSNHGGIFHPKKPFRLVNCSSRDSRSISMGCFYVRVNVSLQMDFCGSANHVFLYDTDQCQWSKRQQIPRYNNSGFNLSRSHEILSRKSVVTSRHDVTPQKGGFSIASNRTGKSEAGEINIDYSLPSPSPSNDTFVVGSSGR